METTPNKLDQGKPQLNLVPIQAMWVNIARVREYGCRKYKDPNNWKTVELERYYNAFFRHVAAMVTNPEAVDEESGLPHSWHAACNLAFIFALEKEKEQ